MSANGRSGLLAAPRPRLVLIAVAVLGVALLLVFLERRSDQTADNDRGTTRASTLLDIELATFDGAPVRLESYVDGRPLVVNFFASWCGPCVREMPHFEAVHRRRRHEVRFLGVNLEDSPDAATELVRKTGVTYDVARDEDGELFRALNGFSMPTTVFLSARGDVVEVHGGELSERALEARIDRLLGR